ncbi:MAG: YjfB family protein [Treponema sp.]|nr:YjfB family protein [Treponema sp.]
MDIQNLSIQMAQNRVQEDAAISVQAKMIQNMKIAGEDLTRLIESASIITDPAKGNNVNLLA